MVEALALKIALALKKAEPEKTASVDVMKFALIGLINTGITFLLIAAIGIATRSIKETMLGFAAFAVLRFLSGGLHLKNAMSCSLLSTLFVSAAPHLPLQSAAVAIVTGISLLLVVLYAPANMEGHARIPSKYFIVLKGISMAIVSANFFALEPTIAVVFLVQTITLISWKRR